MSATPVRLAVLRPPCLPARRSRLTKLVITLVVVLVVVTVVWPVDHAAADLVRLLLAVAASTIEIASWLGRTDRHAVTEGQV
ncbi:hypothetical protein [Actinomadura terrae]|uniref:hypothetical protein n=1 Tax=Actinomadura terrae TaxID=604353 RepID=UPI001FA73FB8|nr:hypothetical protein [Actinomadura terrae]